jgi:hypothetical protein
MLALSFLLALTDRIAFNGAVSRNVLKMQVRYESKSTKPDAQPRRIAQVSMEGIVLSAWAALRTVVPGNVKLSAGYPFDRLVAANQPGVQWRETSIDRCVIVMADIAAEAVYSEDGRRVAPVTKWHSWPLSPVNANKGTECCEFRTCDRIPQAQWGALQAVLMMREISAFPRTTLSWTRWNEVAVWAIACTRLMRHLNTITLLITGRVYCGRTGWNYGWMAVRQVPWTTVQRRLWLSPRLLSHSSSCRNDTSSQDRRAKAPFNEKNRWRL